MSAKTKFSSADVRAMVRCVRSSCLGKRVANIYDISDKMYIFKFNSTGGERLFLVLESGVRFHMTKFSRQHHNQPSPFAMKLRGLLGTKKLEQIQQLGFDRVVLMRFGSGDYINYVLLELYAGGNIVVTDENFKVVALLRSHQFAADVNLQVGEIYPMAHVTNIADSVASSDSVFNGPFASIQSFHQWIRERLNQELSVSSADDAPQGAKSKRKTRVPNLRQTMLHKTSGVSDLGTDVIEHVLVQTGVGANIKLAQALEINEQTFTSIVNELIKAKGLVESLDQVDGEGFIIYKDLGDDKREYMEYSPFLLSQHQDSKIMNFPCFSDAVDDYYYKLEDQKAQQAAAAEAEAIKKKFLKVKEDQEKMIENLQRQQMVMELSARIVQARAEDIDKVFLVINSFLDSGLSWDEIEDTVEIEQARGNPIAGLISRLELSDNKIFLKFSNSEVFEQFCDENEDGILSSLLDDNLGFLEIAVDLSLSAHANAAKMFQSKKAASLKESKTIKNAIQVTKSMEEQTMKKLETIKLSTSIKAMRKVHWFEKFNWFITSEGFLVLSGKDAQQNDLLFRRYLRESDIYVHADVHGASSCVVRAKRHNPENLDNPNVSSSNQKFYVTPLAIQEAGAMAVCRSRAWTAKFTASAYWVKASQVSKAAPSGEYLTTGAFMIYGKKNYLPPMQLEMGFGIMFRLDDESVGRHLKDRKIRSYDFDEVATIDESLSRYDLNLCTNDEFSSALNGEIEECDDGPSVEESDTMSCRLTSSARLLEISKDFNEPSVECNSIAEIDFHNRGTCEADGDDNDIVENDVEDESVQEERDENQAVKTTTFQDNMKHRRSCEKKDLLQTESTNKTNKKKVLNKKKAKRYAEQDDDDRELAMMVLGHRSKLTGETLEDRRVKEEKAKELEDIKRKQVKAGISFVKGNWDKAMALLSDEVRNALLTLVDEGKLKTGEIEDSDLRMLSTFSNEQALDIVGIFANDDKFSVVKNKSGLLGAIMRRISREIENSKIVFAENRRKDKALEVDGEHPSMVLSSEEQKEIKAIQEEEGILEAEEGKQADETEKLTGAPVPEDDLLYAIPVCAPYVSLQGFKYKVKLTPGPMKKGKAAKLAIDLFMKSNELKEKSLMKGFTDNELVSAMIGDVKVSTPGLQQHQKQKKVQRGQKK